MVKTKLNKQIFPLISGIIVAFFIALISGIVMTTIGPNYITPGIPIHIMTFLTISGTLIVAFLINLIFKGFRKK